MRKLNTKIAAKIQELQERGAIFYVSHSGGKDSQCMQIKLDELVPEDQIVIIHAHLQGIEWADTRKQIHKNNGSHAYLECQAKKTWWEMVDHRQMFPGPKYRQCTSDLKRDPLHKLIRNDLKRRGKTLGVNCVGLRAEESTGRSKMDPIKLNKRLSKAGREVWELLPVHDFTLAEVFGTIAAAGQEPHWVYSEGNERMSCVFCIMGSTNDFKVGARLNPELYRRYVEKERELGFTLKQGATLEEITGVYLDGRGPTRPLEQIPMFADTEFACGV